MEMFFHEHSLTNEVKPMIEQSVLPFKLAETNDSLTPHAGLALFAEFLHALKLPDSVEASLPSPGSGAGYSPSQFVLPLLLMLHGGGRALEDLREIRSDRPLCELAGIGRVPSADAVGDWLRRMGSGRGLSDLRFVNRGLVDRQLSRDERSDYTLDIDATLIEAEKRDAAMTYKGFKGYAPLVGHLAENGMVLQDEFRTGNDSPQSRNLEFLRACVVRMPLGKRIARFRSDSAAYQAAVLDYCADSGIEFAVGADLDAGVQRSLMSVEAWRPYQDGLIGETSHSMNASRHSFRIVAVKRPSQQGLFVETSPRVKVIATNREGSAEDVVEWYNQRGECSENRIKELKLGVGMERLPCGDFGANAVFFRIGVIGYNLFLLFRSAVLPSAWSRYQLQTVRWKLYQVAGKVVYHGNRLWLKVRRVWRDLFVGIRRGIYAFSLG
jgi:hypothetical protein